MFSNRIRYFNKYLLNRLTIRSAGSAHSHFAIIRHVGRRSGKVYETPIIVMPKGEDFVLALTYGPKVDWYRNLLASEQGTVLWHGKKYTISKPEKLDRSTALAVFSPLQQRILRFANVQDFALVHSLKEESLDADATKRTA
jgi:deazaflavin-dependent oxidoreductase (nitroreductase family)